MKELKEREWRKKNICIRVTRGNIQKHEVMKKVEEITDIKWREVAEQIWEVKDNMVRIRIREMSDKVELMRTKGKMKGSDIWIDDDLTSREIEVQKWLRKEAEKEEKMGRRVKISYMKIEIDGEWMKWDERSGRLDKFFRRRGSF
ncbi:hypothetical protein PV327_007446 [Microctonus hyperodae]|uniref:Uncharacterized protein n=1 Tax=Microctonus hyperodae TaxID=165561 RepID=A0AA39KYG8_MICHY|nr:hypothetical protein PV327_007446 [Microctonus hyperodae]